MAEGLKLYESDDTTALGPIAFDPAPTPSTTLSAAVDANLWNDKGAPSGAVRRGVKLRLSGEISVGVISETGAPFLDRRELQMRITGSSNPGNDPLFIARGPSAWQPIGNGILF